MLKLKETVFPLFLILLLIASSGWSTNGSPVSLTDANTRNDQPRWRGKYILLSLLLPGAGELAMGAGTTGKIFLGTEIALWAGYFGSLSYADVLQRDFMAFAAVHAGVNTHQKTEQFWIDIGNADNIYRFNEKKRVQRDLTATYPETDEYYWQWDNRDNRLKYNDLRARQHNWKRAATFIIGGMILNRVLSAVDVVRLLRKQSKERNVQQSSSIFWNYRFNRLEGDVVTVNLIWNF